MKIYLAGNIVPQEKAAISASDHGFLFGVAVFETFRTYGGSPFLLGQHLERMRAGCRALHIDFSRSPLLAEETPSRRLREVVRELLSVNGLEDAAFRFTMSAGEAEGVLPAEPYANPVEVIHIRPLHPSLPPQGQRLHILNTERTDPEVRPRPKSVHYINSLSGHWELRQRQLLPGDEGLMRTRDGRLAEGVVSNLFVVSGDGLKTPSLAAGILGGITRQAVLGLAKESGLAFAETDLGLSDLTSAEAIFTTNSTRGLVPVYDVRDQAGHSVWNKNSSTHPVVTKLARAYERLTRQPE